ncbi:transposase, partial [Enterococcus faecalis]|uniref:transposase n=1 Tax=Enterococcus faecalis TaxID=1351 RepID=UPI003D0F2702
YYDYLKWKPSKSAQKRQQMKQQVLNYWLKYPMYGYPRIAKYLKKTLNLSISRYLVYRLIRELGIQSRMIKKMKKPKSYTEIVQRPNLIKKLTDKSSVLLTDITYIPVKKKWIYLASLYSSETRRGEAHKIGRNMTKELATSVIQSTILKELGTKIIHSDMGSQYTSDLFEHTLNCCKVKHSYSRKGCPGDNARIESFHSILKREYINFQFFNRLKKPF